MPEVRPLIASEQIEYEWKKLSIRVMHDCKDLRITNTALANEIGVTSQAISKQFKERRIQIPTLLAYERLKGEKEKNEAKKGRY